MQETGSCCCVDCPKAILFSFPPTRSFDAAFLKDIYILVYRQRHVMKHRFDITYICFRHDHFRVLDFEPFHSLEFVLPF